MNVTVAYLMMKQFPLQLGRGGNDRKHWRAADRQKKAEKEAVAWMFRGAMRPPVFPCVVTITRIAPSAGLDDDNLSGACKYIRDGVAEWIGVDDKKTDKVRYQYAQERGQWAVRVRIEA